MLTEIIKAYTMPVPTRESMDNWHKAHSDPSVKQSPWPDRLYTGIWIVLLVLWLFGQAVYLGQTL